MDGQLLSKIFNMDIHKVRIRVDFQNITPDMFSQVNPGDHPVFIQNKVIENLKLFAGQTDLLPFKTYLMIFDVQNEIMNIYFIHFQFMFSPDNGMHTCQQFC
ncbi:hypothetical protein D3C87_1810400 [compost metagenome]